MENLILLLTASLVLYKSSKTFRKTTIGDTRCSVNYSPEAVFDFTRTEEGDSLYYAEHQEKGVSYGVLCARVEESMNEEEAREVMTTYINRLHRPFNALYNTGIHVCPRWTEEAGHTELVDYWQDEDGQDWKVKGYTDGQVIAILYVKNISELEVEKQDAFLDSFSFGKALN